MSRSDILTESVKVIFAKKRKRLLEEDGGLSVFVGQGHTPPTISFAVRESNALEVIRQSSLSQAKLLDKTGYVPEESDKDFVGAYYRVSRRRGGFSSDSDNSGDSPVTDYGDSSSDSEPSIY